MKKVRYITDAAMITAIVIAILLLSELTGLELEEAFFFLIPAPVALYALLHGAKKSMIPAFAISLLATLIHEPLHGLLFVFPPCLVGVLYGFCVEKRCNNLIKIAVAIFGAFVVNLLTSVIFSKLLFGINIIDDTTVLVTEFIALLSALHLDTSFSALLEALAIGLIPAFLVVISAMEGLATHMITIFLANRVIKSDRLGVFRGIRFMIPRILTILAIPVFLACMIFLGGFLNMTGWAKTILVIGINLSFILLVLYDFEALLVCAAYSRVTHRYWVYYIAVLLAFVLAPAMAILGICDSLFRLRDNLQIT